MLPKSKALKGDSTEIVDVAGIDTRIFALPREISNCTCYGLRSQQRSVCHEQSVKTLWSCLNDEGRPLGVGVQAQAPNHLYVAGLKRFGEKR